MAVYNIIPNSVPARGLDMDALNFRDLGLVDFTSRTPTLEVLERQIPLGSPYTLISAATIGGTLGYSATGQLYSGQMTDFSLTQYSPAGRVVLRINGMPNLSVAALPAWIGNNDTAGAFGAMLSGDDTGHGGTGDDLMRGYAGNDTLNGAEGSDTIWGGLGNDQIYAHNTVGSGLTETDSNYLRGEEGNDTITGNQGFDDINGNQGDDLLYGGGGDDYVVGGKDNDVQYGEGGNDIVWGNLGDDTVDGGDGNDQVRGGQGNDSVSGGNGNDFVSGDRGNDTISGGAGADIFHSSQDAGIDRVLDFSLAQGDRVMLDPGTTYTASQVGADTVIDMGGGNQMILVGVTYSTLTPGWIFLG